MEYVYTSYVSSEFAKSATKIMLNVGIRNTVEFIIGSVVLVYLFVESYFYEKSRGA